MSDEKYYVSGNQQIWSEVAKAMEGLPEFLAGLGDDHDLAEVRIGENMPIVATVMDEAGVTEYVWNFEKWIQTERHEGDYLTSS